MQSALHSWSRRGSNDEVIEPIPYKISADRRASNKMLSYRLNPHYFPPRWAAPTNCAAVFFDWARHRCLQRGRGTNKKNNRRNFGCWRKGDLGGVRTHDPQLRRLLLYPTELRDHHKKQPMADNLYSKIHSMAIAVQKYIKYIELQNI